jgi:hypothetical protein
MLGKKGFTLSKTFISNNFHSGKYSASFAKVVCRNALWVSCSAGMP